MEGVWRTRICESTNRVNGSTVATTDIFRVLWFNLGTHHLPTSADIPVTLMTTSASSIIFVPFNYFDEDRSRKYATGIEIDNEQPGPIGKEVDENGEIDQTVLQSDRTQRRPIPQAWPERMIG